LENGGRIAQEDAARLDKLLFPTKVKFYTKAERDSVIKMLVNASVTGGDIYLEDIRKLERISKELKQYGYNIADFSKFYHDHTEQNMDEAFRLFIIEHVKNVYYESGMSIDEEYAEFVLRLNSKETNQLNRMIAAEKVRHKSKGEFSINFIVARFSQAKALMNKYRGINLENAMNMLNFTEELHEDLFKAIHKEMPGAFRNEKLVNAAIAWRLKYFELIRKFNFKPLAQEIKKLAAEFKSLHLDNLEALEAKYNAALGVEAKKLTEIVMRAINFLYLQQLFEDHGVILDKQCQDKMEMFSDADLSKIENIFVDHVKNRTDEEELTVIIARAVEFIDQRATKGRRFSLPLPKKVPDQENENANQKKHNK
ncbi:MAG: hypothetical protein M3R00_04170, partial [Pseudomonadota bacterium]|nr:hypothetical protein [Pseudomonadota bacterium]